MTAMTRVLLCVLLASAGAARAGTGDDILATLDDGMQGPPSRVLVLGSVHLSDLPASFDPAALDPVIDRLRAFRPDVVTIEAIPGEQCDLARRHPAVYGETGLDDYCSDPAAAAAATGLDVPAAIAEVRRMLAAWPASPAPAQRRRLAAAMLAANDDASALVQWLQLPAAERKAGETLTERLAAQLDRMARRRDEGYLIAARVAASLGLQRVYAVDDHSGDNLDLPPDRADAFRTAVQQAWASGAAQASATRAQQAELAAGSDMLALYRHVNRPDVLRIAAASDFGAAMREPSPGRPAQVYVAGWETRNLRMVANIREAFREQPGARVLSIVGFSHKPWFEALLGRMQGVELVDALDVLE